MRFPKIFSSKKVLAFLVLCMMVISGARSYTTVFAATGTIDPIQKYSQFVSLDLDKNGIKDLINWLPTCGGIGGTNACPNPVVVSDTKLTGDIWGRPSDGFDLIQSLSVSHLHHQIFVMEVSVSKIHVPVSCPDVRGDKTRDG